MSASRSGQKLKSSGSKGDDGAAGPSISLLSKTIGTRGRLSAVSGKGGGDGADPFPDGDNAADGDVVDDGRRSLAVEEEYLGREQHDPK